MALERGGYVSQWPNVPRSLPILLPTALPEKEKRYVERIEWSDRFPPHQGFLACHRLRDPLSSISESRLPFRLLGKNAMLDNGLNQRKAWFDWYYNKIAKKVVPEAKQPGQAVRCPCCHCRTLSARGMYIICPVCFWEDDGQDDADADMIRGGPNGSLSLTAARHNYLQHGACDPKFLPNVRPPLPEETDTEYSI